MLYALLSAAFIASAYAACKESAATCTDHSECCADKKGMPGKCFDFGWSKGCVVCEDLGIQEDCEAEVMDGSGCRWSSFYEKCQSCASEGQGCKKDSDCCKMDGKAHFCFELPWMTSCATCEALGFDEDCIAASHSCVWNAETETCSDKPKDDKDDGGMCCQAMTKECMMCKKKKSGDDVCAEMPDLDGCGKEKATCDMEGMCCPTNFECMEKVCTAENGAMTDAQKCMGEGGKCMGNMSMMDEKCGQATDADTCKDMTSSPFSSTKICKWVESKKDDDTMCCMAMTKDCMMCKMKQTGEEVCAEMPELDGCPKKKGDCEYEGMCCPTNFTCKMNASNTEKACVAENGAEVIAVKCMSEGGKCLGQMSMMDAKCGVAEDEDSCKKMTSSPFSSAKVCKWVREGGDKDDGKDGGDDGEVDNQGGDDEGEDDADKPYESFADYVKDCGGRTDPQSCKACLGKYKKNKCRPQKNAKKIKCSKVKDEAYCAKLGCQASKKKKKVDGKKVQVFKKCKGSASNLQ